MEILAKNISDIIVAEANAINDKVKSLNFLELLKINIFEKLLPLIKEQKILFNKSFDFENEIENKIFVKINYLVEPFSVNKKIIEYDSLFISLNETSNLDIYQDEKKYTNIILNKNNAVSLPKNSVISFRYNKNTLLVEIQNKNTEQALTN